MNLEDITKDLESRFKEPYQEFYNRRIIFWIDNDREFEEEISDLQIENVKIISMSENNKFRVKKLVSYDDQESDFLVYCPLIFNEKEDNWIIDILKYSEEFRADFASIKIDQMNLPNNIGIRKCVKEYKKFFNAKARMELIKKHSNRIENPAHLELAIMGEIAACKIEPVYIIREVLKAGINNDENPIYQEFINYKIDETFWTMVEQGTGYCHSEKSLENLALHIFLTAASRNIVGAFLGLDDFISPPHETFCFQFINDWLKESNEKDSLYSLARYIEDKINLFERLCSIELVYFENDEIFPCVDEAILCKIMTNIKNDIIDPEEIFNIYDNRRVLAWFKDFEVYYEGIYNMGKIKDFYNNNQSSFHMTYPREVWESYTNKLYLMDSYYRKFQMAYQKSLGNSNIILDDLFKFTVDRAEGIYKNWFLEKLLTNWTNVSAKEFEDYGRLSEVKYQMDFYRQNVEPSNTKTYVIISDAMRYEVARELFVDLKKTMQCDIEIDDMVGVFPTITPFGMAALLPNNGLEVEFKNDRLKVLIDGQSTDMSYRENILKNKSKNSVVLKYEELIHMKREERQNQVKGMDVIYIYHDQIDSASHISDSEVFYACDKTIDELKNLVKILVNEFSAVNIMITSDHGFLYTYEEFTEVDKLSKENFEGVVDYGRRYAIANKNYKPNYMMPIKFLDGNSNLRAYAPKQNIRIKKRGGGVNFVHGGNSLQEIVIPLIKFRHIRTDSKEYKKNKSLYDTSPVELNILSSVRKICNMIFNLSFYQSEMLSENKEAASFLLYFIDENEEKISDEVRIIADKDTSDDQDRVFNVRFNLKAGKYDNKKSYHLVILEESGRVLPKKIEFTIDIPFATGEYDFFS